MKVLYVSPGYTTHDRRFLCSFSGASWDVTHLTLTDSAMDHRPRPDGVRAIAWPGNGGDMSDARHWAGEAGAMSAVISEAGPDVIIAGSVHSGACAVAQAGVRPLVTVSWGSDILVDALRDDFTLEATRFTLDRSDAVFGDCRAVRDAVHRFSGIADEQIITFPWGIDLERFSHEGPRAPIAERLGWEDKDIFISTRTWEPLYAIDVLVEAFAVVNAERPDARLILLGDGSLTGSIHDLIDRMGLRDLIHTPGRLSYEELPGYFRASSFYVSSALSDGTSVSLLEAMACGLPVVVTGSYGNLEWVEEGVNGALAPPGDAPGLAAAMLKVSADPALRAAMRAENIATARARANWDTNFPRLREVVEDLASP